MSSLVIEEVGAFELTFGVVVDLPVNIVWISERGATGLSSAKTADASASFFFTVDFFGELFCERAIVEELLFEDVDWVLGALVFLDLFLGAVFLVVRISIEWPR